MTSVYRRAVFVLRSGRHKHFVGLNNYAALFRFETHCRGSNDGMITQQSTGRDVEGSGFGQI
jgi:hypothetical protein